MRRVFILIGSPLLAFVFVAFFFFTIQHATASSLVTNGSFSASPVTTGWAGTTNHIRNDFTDPPNCFGDSGHCFYTGRNRYISQTIPVATGSLFIRFYANFRAGNTSKPCVFIVSLGSVCSPESVGVHAVEGCVDVSGSSVVLQVRNFSITAIATHFIDNVEAYFYPLPCSSTPWLTPTPAATSTPYLGAVMCFYVVDIGGGVTATVTTTASILHNTDFETVSSNPIVGTAAEYWHRNADGAKPPVTENYTTSLGLKPHALGGADSWAYDAFLNGSNQYCQTATIPDGLDHFNFYALVQPQPYICDGGGCTPYRYWEFGAVSGEGTHVYTMTQGDAVQQISGTVDVVGVGGSFVFCYSSYGDLDGYLDQLELIPYSSSDNSSILCVGPTLPLSETNPFPTPSGGPTAIATFAFPTPIATPTPGTIGVFPTIAPGIGLTPQATACVGWNSFTLDVPFSGSFPFDVPTGTVDGVQLCLEPIIVQANLPAPIPDSVSESFSAFITLSFSAIIVSLVIGIVRSR
jgi:hypothetical protein